MPRSIRVLLIVLVTSIPTSIVVQTADVIFENAAPTLPISPPPLPVGDVKKPVVALLEDDAHLLIPHLENNYEGIEGNPAASEEMDVFSGASALRVAPLQRFSPTIAGWAFTIAEKPKAGQFRFVRFAWKKTDGNGVMLQLHDPVKSWFVRYHAGVNSAGWESKQVAEKIPTEWTVVTRDLFADFGPMTLTGIAFTPMDGMHAMYDHVLLGRSVEDLDARTDEALGRVKPKTALTVKESGALWAELNGRDREKAASALRRFLASAPDQIGFIREKLTTGSGLSAEQVKTREKTTTKLIADLDADKFDTREAAENELEKLGAAAEGAVIAAAKSDSAEVSFRATRLIGKLKLDHETPMSSVRAARVVRVLERAANADAKALLKQLDGGEFGAEYQSPARTALARLK